MATMTQPAPGMSLSFPFADALGSRVPTVDTVSPSTLLTAGVRSVVQLSLPQATDLLDWLEVHGIEKRDVMFDESGLVTVRWEA